MKSILFLSALDFKEKSIQVIRKTPEAYRDAGWDVTYIVARDNCPIGNYYYENIIELSGIKTIRTFWPFPKLRSLLPSWCVSKFTKIVSWIVSIKLLLLAIKVLKKNDIKLIYGYEIQGILAMIMLKIIYKNKYKYISRFQGTFLYEHLKKRKLRHLLFNLDHILCLNAKVDLLIMTNDGTQGDKALLLLNSPNRDNYVFYKNGVDFPYINTAIVDKLNQIYKKDKTIILISISRLVNWKRIDRGILFAKKLNELGLKIKYIIIGEGDEKKSLQNLVNQLQIKSIVEFVGSVSHENVCDYLEMADYFISFYDGSNVGNPLLEALRQGKIIFTLNNGDTSKFIIHKENGFIYDHRYIDYDAMAKDLILCENNYNYSDKIKKNAVEFADRNLWSWEKRFEAEMQSVNNLL